MTLSEPLQNIPEVNGVPNRKIGRPQEYNQNINVQALGYIESCGLSYELLERPVVRDGKYVGDEQYVKEKTRLPTIEGLALELDISRETVYDWKSKFPEFSDIIDKLMKKQADMLINNGLSGDYNPTIAKVILTKHGYRDNDKLDITSGNKPIQGNTIILKDFNGGIETDSK